MKKFKLLILLLCLSVSQITLPLPVKATTAPSLTEKGPENIVSFLPQDIFPLTKTKIELQNQKISLDLAEKNTVIKGSYHFKNPENKTIRLKIGICLPTQNGEDTDTSPIHVYYQEEDLNITYNQKINAYVWEIEIAPYAETDLEILYTLQNEINRKGVLIAGFHFPLEKKQFRLSETYKCSFTFNFKDTHPGQITELAPNNYYFRDDSLHWQWEAGEEKKDIVIRANITKEKEDWLNLLSRKEQKQLLALDSQQLYRKAVTFLENRYYNYTKTKDKQAILLGQAYYWQKAGNIEKSLEIFANLVNDNAPFPRAFWEVGKAQKQNTDKLKNLLNQIRDLQIHPLLQPWLIAKIPANEIELTPPEITIKYADTNESRKGIIIKSQITDKDGDISKIILRYQWEGEEEKEVSFATNPFQYDYDLLYYTIAPDSFKQLYYQWIITDSAGHEVTSEKKEAFYLSEEIISHTYILDGATLILGDYTREEENKVLRWFKSYLQLAKDAGFVPVEAKNPLLIFMGQKHSFFQDYKGPLFVYYTPSPFASEVTKIPVHRYFLGYWYGQGWHTLPLAELTKLGDALMLNKGWYAQIFTYLQNKDPQLFADLLCTIGEGKNWAEALKQTYHLTPVQLNFYTLWYLIGNYVLALTLIVLFVWLSKKGYLTKLIHFLKTTK